MHGALMFAIVLYIFVLGIIPRQPAQPLDPHLAWALGIVACAAIAIALFVRAKKLGTAFDALRNNAADQVALGQWRQAVIVSDALAISVVLYGLAIYLIGGTEQQAIPFFAAGSVLMIFWWPRRP